MAKGTHDYTQDPRNAGIQVYVNGDLIPREQASVSVFDSGFVLGDGIWEGLRLHNVEATMNACRLAASPADERTVTSFR